MPKIEHDKLMSVIQAAGLTTTRQSSFTRCELKPCRAKIYVANSKMVGRVDLSGFAIEHPGVVQVSETSRLDMKLSKNIMAQLDFDKPEDVIISALANVCEALKAVATGAAINQPSPHPEATTVEETPTDGERVIPTISKEKRMQLIREAAARAAAHAKQRGTS